MLKKNKKMLVLTSLVILLPVLIGLILWNRLPEEMPMHWNAAGEVDGWGSRMTVVFAMPAILLAVHWLCVLVTSADPKRANIGGKPLLLVLWICPVISVLVSGLTYLTALNIPVSVEVVMPLVFGILFVVIGNYIPKCRQSYTLGIRVPWALEDEENWNRTHRFAGKVWTVGGVLIMACSFLGVWSMLAITLVMAFAPMIYSYVYYRNHRGE